MISVLHFHLVVSSSSLLSRQTVFYDYRKSSGFDVRKQSHLKDLILFYILFLLFNIFFVFIHHLETLIFTLNFCNLTQRYFPVFSYPWSLRHNLIASWSQQSDMQVMTGSFRPMEYIFVITAENFVSYFSSYVLDDLIGSTFFIYSMQQFLHQISALILACTHCYL